MHPRLQGEWPLGGAAPVEDTAAGRTVLSGSSGAPDTVFTPRLVSDNLSRNTNYVAL